MVRYKTIITSRNLTYGSYTPPIDVKNWTALINEFDQISFIRLSRQVTSPTWITNTLVPGCKGKKTS